MLLKYLVEIRIAGSCIIRADNTIFIVVFLLFPMTAVVKQDNGQFPPQRNN